MGDTYHDPGWSVWLYTGRRETCCKRPAKCSRSWPYGTYCLSPVSDTISGRGEILQSSDSSHIDEVKQSRFWQLERQELSPAVELGWQGRCGDTQILHLTDVCQTKREKQNASRKAIASTTVQKSSSFSHNRHDQGQRWYSAQTEIT
jgi:hypothetical protein